MGESHEGLQSMSGVGRAEREASSAGMAETEVVAVARAARRAGRERRCMVLFPDCC